MFYIYIDIYLHLRFKQGFPRAVHSVLTTSAARSRRYCLKRQLVIAAGKRLRTATSAGRGLGLAGTWLPAPETVREHRQRPIC